MMKAFLLGQELELHVIDEDNFSLNTPSESIHFDFQGAIQILEVARDDELGDYSLTWRKITSSYLLYDETGYHFETRATPQRPLQTVSVFTTITLNPSEFDTLVEALQEYAAL